MEGKYEYEILDTHLVDFCSSDDEADDDGDGSDCGENIDEERACIDTTVRTRKKFCRVFRVNETRVHLPTTDLPSTSMDRLSTPSVTAREPTVDLPSTPNVTAREIITMDLPSMPTPNATAQERSPSKPWKLNPQLGVATAVKATFRCLAVPIAGGKGQVYTSFALTPEAGGQCVCLMAGHCYKDDGDFRIRGCFGPKGVLAEDIRSEGFVCSSQPLFRLHNRGKENFALFVALDASPREFYLPCSPDELKIGDVTASFTYPAVSEFLAKARRELKAGRMACDVKVEKKGIWDMYRSVLEQEVAQYGEECAKGMLYDMFRETFRRCRSGDLLCSPGVLVAKEEWRCSIRETILGGSSGGPVCLASQSSSGYFFAIHDSAKLTTDLNEATSTDTPAFVRAYKDFVLPLIPDLEDPVWVGRDLEPFRRWLDKHNLATTRKRKRAEDRSSPANDLAVGTSSTSVSRSGSFGSSNDEVE